MCLGSKLLNFLSKNRSSLAVVDVFLVLSPPLRFVDTGEMPETFPYRTKALFAFEEIDGVDVCFFGMHVQEYGSECPFPNTRSVPSDALTAE